MSDKLNKLGFTNTLSVFIKTPHNLLMGPALNIISTASGALVVGGVSDIVCMYVVVVVVVVVSPEIGLSVQWSRTNQSVAVCGSLW